jgi:hypothetical protein
MLAMWLKEEDRRTKTSKEQKIEKREIWRECGNGQNLLPLYGCSLQHERSRDKAKKKDKEKVPVKAHG